MIFNNKGLTLIEIMVSLAILAIGLLGTLGMITTAINANRYANDYQTASGLLQAEAERIREMGYKGLPNVCNSAESSNCAWSENGENKDDQNRTWSGSQTEKSLCIFNSRTGEKIEDQPGKCKDLTHPNGTYFHLTCTISRDPNVPDLLKDVNLAISWQRPGEARQHTLTMDFVVGIAR